MNEECEICKMYKGDGTSGYGDCRLVPPVWAGGEFSCPSMRDDEWCGQFVHRDKFSEMIRTHEPT